MDRHCQAGVEPCVCSCSSGVCLRGCTVLATWSPALPWAARAALSGHLSVVLVLSIQGVRVATHLACLCMLLRLSVLGCLSNELSGTMSRDCERSVCSASCRKTGTWSGACTRA
jgi:hypothetical protein